MVAPANGPRLAGCTDANTHVLASADVRKSVEVVAAPMTWAGCVIRYRHHHAGAGGVQTDRPGRGSDRAEHRRIGGRLAPSGALLDQQVRLSGDTVGHDGPYAVAGHEGRPPIRRGGRRGRKGHLAPVHPVGRFPYPLLAGAAADADHLVGGRAGRHQAEIPDHRPRGAGAGKGRRGLAPAGAVRRQPRHRRPRRAGAEPTDGDVAGRGQGGALGRQGGDDAVAATGERRGGREHGVPVDAVARRPDGGIGVGPVLLHPPAKTAPSVASRVSTWGAVASAITSSAFLRMVQWRALLEYHRVTRSPVRPDANQPSPLPVTAVMAPTPEGRSVAGTSVSGAPALGDTQTAAVWSAPEPAEPTITVVDCTRAAALAWLSTWGPVSDVADQWLASAEVHTAAAVLPSAARRCRPPTTR